MKIDYLDLLHPDPILIEGACNVRHIKIHELNGTKYKNYLWAISTLKITASDILKHFELLNDEEISSLSIEDINIFELWMSNESIAKALIKALGTFVVEPLSFNKSLMCIDAKSEGFTGQITRENFKNLLDAIFQMNFLSSKSSFEEAKPKNKRAAEMLKKFKELEEKKPTKRQKNIELSNIVSAICVGHNSYNMTNVWSLTVYQLYDQFFRQNSKNQIDVMASRWAAWGKEPFDFEVWYQSMK